MTGFVTDVEEGFKTHGHFANQTETFTSVRWIMSVCQAFLALFVLSFSFPSSFLDLLIEFIAWSPPCCAAGVIFWIMSQIIFDTSN